MNECAYLGEMACSGQHRRLLKTMLVWWPLFEPLISFVNNRSHRLRNEERVVSSSKPFCCK
jgi:hypothetical protein